MDFGASMRLCITNEHSGARKPLAAAVGRGQLDLETVVGH